MNDSKNNTAFTNEQLEQRLKNLVDKNKLRKIFSDSGVTPHEATSLIDEVTLEAYDNAFEKYGTLGAINAVVKIKPLVNILYELKKIVED